VQIHSILQRLIGHAKHKAQTVASSGFVRAGAWRLVYLRTGGKSVQLPCATSAAMPNIWPSESSNANAHAASSPVGEVAIHNWALCIKAVMHSYT
jgi:hypothetical protein